jgi:predicted phage tail protein
MSTLRRSRCGAFRNRCVSLVSITSIEATRVLDAADASSVDAEDVRRGARFNTVALFGILFVVVLAVLMACAMRVDRSKHIDVGGFAVVDLLMFAAGVSIVVAGLCLLGGSAINLAR